MRNCCHEDGRRSGGLGEHICQCHEAVGDLLGEGWCPDVEGVDHVTLGPWPAKRVLILKPVGGDHVQVGEHLQGCAQPGVHLTGHGRSDREGGGVRPSHGRIVESRAHHVEGEFSTLKGCGVARADERRGCGDLRGAGPNRAVPQQAIYLAPGSIARLTNTGQGRETGEGIAQ